MIGNFVKWVISFCEIDYEDQELLEYGLVQGITSILGIIIIFIIGYILEIMLESIIFTVTLIPLRMYAGGYHASTRMRCTSVSLVLVLGALGIIWYRKILPMQSLVIGLVESGILFYLIPVDGAEKLDVLERKIYKKRGRIVLGLETLIFVLTINDLNEVFLGSFSVVLILVLCGIVKNGRK